MAIISDAYLELLAAHQPELEWRQEHKEHSFAYTTQVRGWQARAGVAPVAPSWLQQARREHACAAQVVSGGRQEPTGSTQCVRWLR